MPSPITSILRQLSKKDKLKVLTFPYDYIFDSYWDLLDIDTTFWLFKSEKYPQNLLPSTPHKLESELIPIELDFDLIISHDAFTHNIARQLSAFYHIPYCGWAHEGGSQLRSFVSITSYKHPLLPTLSHCTKEVERNPQKIYLARLNDFKGVSTILQGMKIEPIHPNFEQRHEQYNRCAALVNVVNKHSCSEIEECKANGIPVVSIPTPYHDDILIFQDDHDCLSILNNLPIVGRTPTKSIEQFDTELKEIVNSFGEYIYVPTQL